MPRKKIDDILEGRVLALLQLWGYLKQQMNKQQIETLDELKKKISYQWKKLGQIYIDKVLAKWPKRIYLIHKARGFHIEHRLKL
jgi:hypothetical protein